MKRTPVAVSPYERCIAMYTLGVLALEGYLHPRLVSGDMDGYTYAVETIERALTEGLKAYGWQGNVKELIHAGDWYSLAQSQQARS